MFIGIHLNPQMYPPGWLVQKPDGKPLPLEARIPDKMTRKNQQENAVKRELEKRLSYEKMVADISSMAVMVEDLAYFQEQCLQIMGRTLDVSRIYIFKLNSGAGTIENTFEWVAEGVSSAKEHPGQVPKDALDWFLNVLREEGVFKYSNTDDISIKSGRAYIQDEKTKSMLVVPFNIKKQFRGFLGFDECRYHREWVEEDINILKTAGQIVAKTIESKNDENELVKQRSRLVAIFRSVSDAIITVDKALYVIEANRSTEKICGIPKKRIVGQQLEDLSNPILQSCINLLKETLKTGKIIREHQIDYWSSKTEKRSLIATSSPLHENENASTGVVLTIRDITRLRKLERELKDRHRFHKIVGKSGRMQEIFTLIEDLADMETTVLIRGESGTGKEMVANALHKVGNRALKPFVPVNCSVLAENLLESELFGHVKGAFTGAVSEKIGRFQRADGGTLFLDEIADISPLIQLKLLRVLQEKEFERVGDSEPTKVDVRIITSTNCDLMKKVKQGTFREDLYYRLKVMELVLPPLRERSGDIPLLIDHFCAKFNERYKKNITGVSERVLKCFMQYLWPGNIRELEHAIEHAYVLCREKIVRYDHIPLELQDGGSDSRAPRNYSRQDEREDILRMLKQTGGNKAKAARLLDIDRKTLYRRMQKYGLSTSSLNL